MGESCAGRVALVTGSSRGIGAAIAERLAAEGARVALVARTLRAEDSRLDGSLEEVVEVIRSRGGTATAIAADLAAREPSPQQLVATAAGELGPVDILVNNAAAYFAQPLEELTPKRMRIAFEINLRAPLELAQAALPGMRELGRGWILNISSAAADMPRQHPSASTPSPLLYAATKAALERATAALAEELYPAGIAVNALAPQAGVRTAATDQYAVLPDDAVEPLETMAEAALALCSGKPQELTGRVVRSLEFLVERGEAVRTLDGRSLLEGWQPDEIPATRLDRTRNP